LSSAFFKNVVMVFVFYGFVFNLILIK